MSDYLLSDIKFLQGVGDKRASLLNSQISVRTFRDLLYFFPFRYNDRTKYHKISELKEFTSTSSYVQVKARLQSIREIGVGRKSRLSATFCDETGLVEAVWFNRAEWIKKTLIPNNEYIIFGKPQWFNSTVNFPHPELEKITCKPNAQRPIVYGVYPSTETLSQANISTKPIPQLQATPIGVCRPHIIR